jgi:hypothetical protein
MMQSIRAELAPIVDKGLGLWSGRRSLVATDQSLGHCTGWNQTVLSDPGPLEAALWRTVLVSRTARLVTWVQTFQHVLYNLHCTCRLAHFALIPINWKLH